MNPQTRFSGGIESAPDDSFVSESTISQTRSCAFRWPREGKSSKPDELIRWDRWRRGTRVGYRTRLGESNEEKCEHRTLNIELPTPNRREPREKDGPFGRLFSPLVFDVRRSMLNAERALASVVPWRSPDWHSAAKRGNVRRSYSFFRCEVLVALGLGDGGGVSDVAVDGPQQENLEGVAAALNGGYVE